MSVCGMKAAAHWTNALRRKVRKSHGRLCTGFLTTLFVTTALTWPSDSWAQCAPDPAVAGENVVCGPNNVTTGFAFAGPGDLGSFRVLQGVIVDNSTGGPPFAAVDIFDPTGPNIPGISGDVTNEGTILGTGFGDGIYVDGTIGGSFLNSSTGTITGGNTGVVVGGDTGAFTNDGTIKGTFGDGISVFSSIDGAFTNNGTIEGGIDGVYVVDSVNGAFINTASGIISGGDDGVDIEGDIGAFSNAGTITGVFEEGVFVGGNTGAFINTASGIISGGHSGVAVDGNTGAFTNMAGGMITGGGGFNSNALVIYGNLNGNFTNDGTMSVAGGGTDSEALDILGSLNGNFINNGIMSVTGDGFDSDAIDIFGSLNGDFVNTGTISTASSGGDSDAIDIVGSLNGDFMNSGTVSGTGPGSDGLDVGVSLTGSFTNTGRIEGSQDGVDIDGPIGGNFFNYNYIGAGFEAVDVDSIAGSFFNSESGMIMGGEGGVAIEMGTISGGFTNAGMIDGDTDQDGDGAGVEIVSAGGQAATFMNMAGATIVGAIGFDSEAGDEALTNAGSIIGRVGVSIDMGTGADSLTLTTDSVLEGTAFGGDGTDAFFITGVVSEDDNILGFETFTFQGDSAGRSILSGTVDTPTNMLTSGTLLVNGDKGVLGARGGTTTVMSGATLGGTGTVLGATTVQSGGNIAPGASIGTLTNNGDVTFNAGSTFTIEADVVTGMYDRLIVNGAVVIDGATLSYNVGPDDALPPLTPTTFIVLENDSLDPITGSGFAAVTPFNPLSPFVIATVSTTAGDGNDVALTIAADFTVVPDAALTRNQLNTARGLNGLTATPGSDSATLAAALFGLSSAEAPNAFDQLSGEIYASLANVFIRQALIATNGIGNRLSRLQAGIATPSIAPLAFMGVSMAPRQIADAFSQVERAGGPTAYAFGPDPTVSDPGSLKDDGAVEGAPRPYELWIRSLGRFADFDGDGNASGIESSAGALLIGGDVSIAPGLRVGLAVGYGRTDAEIDAVRSDLEADSFHVLAYGAATHGPWHAKAIASYVAHALEVTRSIEFGTFSAIAQADLDAHQLTGYAEFGRTWTFDLASGEALMDGAWTQGRKLAVQPVVALRASYLNRGGFTETGAGAANLTASDEEFVGIEPILGLRLSTEFTSGDITWIPQARIAWSYMGGDLDPPEADLAFVAGGAYTVAGNERDHNGVTIGTGLNFFPTRAPWRSQTIPRPCHRISTITKSQAGSG